jgi:hypothetical protein
MKQGIPGVDVSIIFVACNLKDHNEASFALHGSPTIPLPVLNQRDLKTNQLLSEKLMVAKRN